MFSNRRLPSSALKCHSGFSQGHSQNWQICLLGPYAQKTPDWTKHHFNDSGTNLSAKPPAVPIVHAEPLMP
jgi:hypothetical protein